jgi:hypothetical protein
MLQIKEKYGEGQRKGVYYIALAATEEEGSILIYLP